MPADPIEYRILTHLRDTLAAITIGAGYHYDVLGTAVKLDPNQDVEMLIAPDGPRPFIVLEVKPEAWAYPESFGGLRLVVPVTVHHVNASRPEKDESRLQTYLRGCADVEQAIAVDPSRGGLAVDTTITRRTFEGATDGSQVWALVDVTIVVRRQYGQPNG